MPPEPDAMRRRRGDGQVRVADDRAVLRLGPDPTGHLGHLPDHQLRVPTAALAVEDLDVLQTHQGLDDLTRVAKDKGASTGWTEPAGSPFVTGDGSTTSGLGTPIRAGGSPCSSTASTSTSWDSTAHRFAD
jgi:hypothetical protein